MIRFQLTVLLILFTALPLRAAIELRAGVYHVYPGDKIQEALDMAEPRGQSRESSRRGIPSGCEAAGDDLVQ